MGMTWARAGLHGAGDGPARTRRAAATSLRAAKYYPEPFPVGRQDYYFRYNVGMQLHLIGESLIGWMAWDLMRGVDLLLAQPGIDPERIILLGAVAGGGDPAAVTAALDPRIKCRRALQLRRPAAGDRYPLPDDAERRFNYIGEGSWESTRNLRLFGPGRFSAVGHRGVDGAAATRLCPRVQLGRGSATRCGSATRQI